MDISLAHELQTRSNSMPFHVRIVRDAGPARRARSLLQERVDILDDSSCSFSNACLCGPRDLSRRRLPKRVGLEVLVYTCARETVVTWTRDIITRPGEVEINRY